MKSIQDNHPFDSALMGLNDQYIYYGNGEFYVNTPYVKTQDKKLENGHYYLLTNFNVDEEKETEVVKLVDVFSNSYKVVNILLANLEKNKTIQLVVDFECLDKANWMLMDKLNSAKYINTLLMEKYNRLKAKLLAM